MALGYGEYHKASGLAASSATWNQEGDGAKENEAVLRKEEGRVITDEQVEAALEYLRDSAKPAAIARAQARTLEKYLGVVEAQQKSLHGGKSNAAAQDLARASPEYQAAIEGWQEAVRRDAEFTMLREAAASRIEAWRTQSSNLRAEGKAYS